MENLIRKLKYGWKLFSLLLLTVAIFCYAMFQGGFVSWFLFYSFLPFACYSLILSFYPLHHFQIERSINQEQFSIGDTFQAKIIIRRRFPFPLFYLIVEDIVPYKLRESESEDESKKILFPWFKKTITYEYKLLNVPRGEYVFTTIRLKTGDLFSLIEKESFFHLENSFLVYPKYINLDQVKQVGNVEQGSTGTARSFWEETTIAVGVRDYQPGDRFSSVDWKATARRGSIMTKEFEQMKSTDAVVIMDRSKTEKFELVVTFTASIIRALIKNNVNVGLVSVGREEAAFPLQSNEKHLRDIFCHLAKVDCDSERSLAAVLNENIKWDERKARNIIITAHITIDLVRKLEYLSTYSLYVIKEEGEQTTIEEQVMLERLMKRQATIKIIYEGRFHDGFKEVNSR
ncbi:DUF58 domain-containing protein [Metabacillus fastidiosus]|uniref:DUF58 domain-containing protein n=1 Tax=Metabacillus fastidiosus TaxID=1458 RepID=UPI002DB64AC6|nr:DUF58 domain-containing protein [Metabacillus fastidiosus]MEC2075139.1 DUF58 domain-containing protein [Metabacillus fastidiosus]